MSRSSLRKEYLKRRWQPSEARNVHKMDEAPKNFPSRIVLTHCSASVEWLQDSTSFGGHSRPVGGHRRVSGLVRASLKREARRQIETELYDEDTTSV